MNANKFQKHLLMICVHINKSNKYNYLNGVLYLQILIGQAILSIHTRR
jgi:hypothetical protein